MASLGFDGQSNFNSSQVPDAGFNPLPAGDYLMAITESEMKDTKKGDGKYLKLKLTVLDGDKKGRTLFVNCNVINPSADAQRIGRAELKRICEACSKPTVADSCELHDIPMWVRVAVKARKDESGEYENSIKKYATRAEGFKSPAATSPTLPGAGAAPTTGGAKAPWEK